MGDFSVQVINRTGYLTASLVDFTTVGDSTWPPFLQSIYFQQLTPDMKKTMGSTSHVVSAASDLVDFEAESPDLFQRGDFTYITASNTCGFCTETTLVVYRSLAPLTGSWQRQIISGDTCGGQSTGVLTLSDPNGGATSYLHVANLFGTAPETGTRTAAHGHALQKLTFNTDGTIQELDYTPTNPVAITFTPRSTNNTIGLAVSATDGSGENQIYIPSCNLPTNFLYQTWVSSKSGSLTEVGFNLAGQMEM